MLSKKSSASKVAYGGIFTALIVLFMYLSAVINLLDVAFFVLASVMVGICLLETGPKLTIAVYIASSAVNFIVIPNMFNNLAYCVFFGLIPLIYYYIDLHCTFKIKKAVIVTADIVYAGLVYKLISLFYVEYFSDVSYPFLILLAFFLIYYPLYKRVTDNIYRLFKRAVK